MFRAGIILGVIAHIVVLLIALQRTSYLTDDSIQYLTIADNIFDAGLFSQSISEPIIKDAQRTPGYAIFLAMLGQFPWLILLVQHALSILTAFMIGEIVTTVSNKRNGILVNFFWLFQPYALIFGSLILAETLFIFLLVAALRYWLKWSNSRKVDPLLVSTILVVFAAYVKPVGVVAAVLFPLLTTVRIVFARKNSWQVFIMPIMVVLLFLPWMIRNQNLTGHFTFTTMAGTGNIHGRLAGMISGTGPDVGNETTWYMVGDSVLASKVGMNQLRLYPKEKQTHETLVNGVSGFQPAIQHALNDPGDATTFMVRSWWSMGSGVCFGWSNKVIGSKPIAFMIAGFQAILNLLLVGFFAMFLLRIRRSGFFERFCIVLAFGFLIATTLVWADGRYRMIMDPLILIAGFAAISYQSKASER